MLGCSVRPVGALIALAIAGALGGCSPFGLWQPETALVLPREAVAIVADAPRWGETTVVVGASDGFEEDGPYRLDSGDRLRIFVYAQPNLSRIYTVDQEGRVAVPLIGDVPARGRTTRQLARLIASRLGTQFVRDPQVTVDIAQNRPFFILGEVRNAGQYPYVSGMTVQSAVAIAGGYADRANERRVQITRRHSGIIEKMDVPPDYVVKPGDTLYVYERWL